MVTTIPLSIAKYIRSLWMSELILTYLHIDAQGVLSSWGGHPRHYGLSHLVTGAPAVEQISFLEGLLPVPHTEVLQFVNLGNGCSAHIHIVPFQDGTWILLFDATAEHERQQRLQQQYNDLSLLAYRQSQMLGELETARAALLAEKQRLEQAGDQQRQFIATLSHELRTPLTSIVGYTKLLDGLKQADATQSAYLGTVKRNADHLLTLIDNVLDQAKIEAGKVSLHPVPCEADKLLQGLRDLFYPQALEKGLSLDIQISPNLPRQVVVDELRLRQILINLITNALKFTRQGSVRASLDWRDNRLRFSVADTGPGIPPASQARLFTAYHRDGSVHSLPGAGLGLSISHQLAGLMGGELRLERSDASGTVFSGEVLAPLAQPAPEAAQPGAVTVLLVEDSPMIRMLLEHYLREAGYQVLAASDGEQAVSLARQAQPALILMDLHMPGMNGYDATRQLRARGYQAPIIALSASSFEQDRLDAVQAGCNDYVCKPVSNDVLLSTVQRTLAENKKT